MGMNFPEQADFAAESSENTGIYKRLLDERDRVGSTRAYLDGLQVSYESVPEHYPNMLQLQRIARLYTNPTNEPTFPGDLTKAFYWGEILAYTMQERMVGETWPTSSYEMLNYAMTTKLAELRDKTVPQSDNLLNIAATAMGELEMATIVAMPPGTDELIVEWAEQITDNEAQQSHIILGFRHINAEVIQAVLRYEKHQIRKQFDLMMTNGEINDVKKIKTEPINDVRDRIMQYYTDQVIEYGAFDKNDEAETDAAIASLKDTMNKAFVQMEGIEVEDFLHITGNAVFIIYNEATGERMTHMLDRREALEGTVDAIAIVETPSTKTIMRLQEYIIDTTDAEEETNPIGVVLMLKHPVFVDKDGKNHQIGGDLVAGLVMSNPDMHMSKYVF